MRPAVLSIILVISVTLLGACGARGNIEGTVKDVFGSPLEGVTVSIEKSKFTSVSDKSGKYSLDYAPGTFVVQFSKSDFTTVKLELNIQQKTSFPAQDTTLYPIPPPSWNISYLDLENRRLAPLDANSTITETSQSTGFMEDIVRYAITMIPLAQAPGYNLPSIKPGKVSFIVMTNDPRSLDALRAKDNVVYEFHGVALHSHKILYAGNTNPSVSRVGEEKMLLLSADLLPGTYAWVPYTGLLSGESVPKDKGVAFTFRVGSATASPRPAESAEANQTQSSVSPAAPAEPTVARGPGLCGSAAYQRGLVPDFVCIHIDGQVRMYEDCEKGPTVVEKGLMSIVAAQKLEADLTKSPPLYVYFGEACNQHDRCYGEKGAKKSDCESRFAANLQVGCKVALLQHAGKKQAWPSKETCDLIALRYENAVREKGCEPFKDAQQRSGIQSPVCS